MIDNPQLRPVVMQADFRARKPHKFTVARRSCYLSVTEFRPDVAAWYKRLSSEFELPAPGLTVGDSPASEGGPARGRVTTWQSCALFRQHCRIPS